MGTLASKIQPSVDEVQQYGTWIAIKVRRREPGRDGKILSDHIRQDGNVAVSGTCTQPSTLRPIGRK